jgi:hypothetical protein
LGKAIEPTNASGEKKKARVVQSDNLSALEFGQRRESGLEHPPSGVTKSGYKAVEDKFWAVGSRPSVSLM